MNKKKAVIIAIILLLLLLGFFFYFKFANAPTTSQPQNTGNKSVVSNEQTLPAEIIKCQSVVVTPAVTTELFAYVSGNKIRADYRIGTMKEETSYTSQVLFDGQWLYIWNPAPRFDPNVKVENPPGMKMKTNKLDIAIDLNSLDKVERFGGSGFSGDRLCSKWDDVDPVFEVPNNVQFNESSETGSKFQENISKICQICDTTKDEPTKLICRKNLGC